MSIDNNACGTITEELLVYKDGSIVPMSTIPAEILTIDAPNVFSTTSDAFIGSYRLEYTATLDDYPSVTGKIDLQTITVDTACTATNYVITEAGDEQGHETFIILGLQATKIWYLPTITDQLSIDNDAVMCGNYYPTLRITSTEDDSEIDDYDAFQFTLTTITNDDGSESHLAALYVQTPG